MIPNRLIIHTNAPLAETIGLQDSDGNWLEIDETGTYRAEVKQSRDDPASVIELTVTVIPDDDHNVFAVSAELEAVSDLTPGQYIADLLRTDDPEWIIEFPVSVVLGITTP